MFANYKNIEDLLRLRTGIRLHNLRTFIIEFKVLSLEEQVDVMERTGTTLITQRLMTCLCKEIKEQSRWLFKLRKCKNEPCKTDRLCLSYME